jgi:hypothetical protein
MLHQELWRPRKEENTHDRVPTRWEWDGCRKVLIGTTNCSRRLLNQNKSWVIEVELEEIHCANTRKRCKSGAVDGEGRKWLLSGMKARSWWCNLI